MVLGGKLSFSGESPPTIRAWQAGNNRYAIGPSRFVTAYIIDFFGSFVTERCRRSGVQSATVRRTALSATEYPRGVTISAQPSTHWLSALADKR